MSRRRKIGSLVLACVAVTGVVTGCGASRADGSAPRTAPWVEPPQSDAAQPDAAAAAPASAHASLARAALVDPAWPANDGSGCPAPRWPRTLSSGAPAGGARVLVIGDSRTRESRKPLVAALVAGGWTPTVRCWGWKDIDWGIAQVRRARHLHQLPRWVVVALGINDMKEVGTAGLNSRIDRLLATIGPGHHILWLEEYSNRSPRTFSSSHMDYAPKVASFNRHLRARAGASTGLTVIPWVRVVEARHLHLFDGIHYDRAGYKARAKAVADALDARIGA